MDVKSQNPVHPDDLEPEVLLVRHSSIFKEDSSLMAWTYFEITTVTYYDIYHLQL